MGSSIEAESAVWWLAMGRVASEQNTAFLRDE
jgi:hypothetical protein